MNKLKSITRFISGLTIGALLFGIAAVPSASAAELVFSGDQPSVFNQSEDSSIQFAVGAQDNNNNAFQASLYVEGPIGEQNSQKKLISTQEYLGNILNLFEWDGEFDGINVDPGYYDITIESGQTDTIKHEVLVVADETKLSFDKVPKTQFTLGEVAEDYSIELENFIAKTDLEIWAIEKNNPNAVYLLIEEYTYNSDLIHTFKFDGKNINDEDLNPGTYELYAEGTYDDEGETTKTSQLPFVVEVLPETDAVQLDIVGSTASVHTLGEKDYNVNVELSKYDGNEVEVSVAILNDNNFYIPIETHIYTSNGTHEFVLDLSDYEVGSYDAQVIGQYGNNKETNEVLFDFEVKKVADNTCAGYKDIDSDDPNCKALMWLQDENIMTGQGNGDFFDPNGTLNRAEVSKISTEAHNKYNENVNYCGNSKPFPDVALDQWFSNYICRAKAIGMVTGYKAPDANAGLFIPGNAVSVIEMFAILLRPLDGETFISGAAFGLDGDEWYSPYANYADDNNLYTANNLSTTKSASRLTVGLFLYEMHEAGLL